VTTQASLDPAAELRRKWGEQIKARRVLVNFTQQVLANDLGVTQQAVASWESGSSAPRPHMQVEIARVLRTDWAVLFRVDA
jgi:transcriptional regulator with XRE-family HTH domain